MGQQDIGYAEVVAFLCGNRGISVTDEEKQEPILQKVKEVCYLVCLPDVNAVFYGRDDNLSLGLSRKDTETFRKLFNKRWAEIKETEEAFISAPEPEVPEFLGEHGKRYMRVFESSGTESSLSGISGQNKVACEKYFSQLELRRHLSEAAIERRFPLMHKWEEENLKYDFASLTDTDARLHYDTCREAYIPEP